MAANTTVEDRVIQLGLGLSAIPERLLLAHARGEVLFICGAGISRPAGLPDFRQLVIDVYAKLDTSTHSVLTGLPPGACNHWQASCAGLPDLLNAGNTPTLKAYLRSILGSVVVDDKTITIVGSKYVLARVLTGRNAAYRNFRCFEWKWRAPGDDENYSYSIAL